MALKGQITIDETFILEVDADPSIDGVDAPLSSIALIDNNVNGKIWIKTSASSTGWTEIPLSTAGVSYGSPVALSPDSGNIEGVASTVARSDHKHDLPAAAPTTNLSGATTNAEGTSSSVARSDHTHTINNATTSIAGLMSATDKTKLDALVTKSAIVASGSFSGNPKVYAVTFSTPFASANYAINITGIDVRIWTFESVSASGFTINTNANTALSGNVTWQAQLVGEVG